MIKIPTSDETRFYLGLQVFFNKNGEFCADVLDLDREKDEAGALTHLKDKDYNKLGEKLSEFIKGYYDILDDIKKEEKEKDLCK